MAFCPLLVFEQVSMVVLVYSVSSNDVHHHGNDKIGLLFRNNPKSHNNFAAADDRCQ